MFCKKGVLRNFTKFTGNHLCQTLFFNKARCEPVRNLKPEDVGKKKRYDLIIAKLDAVCLQDEASHALYGSCISCIHAFNLDEFIVEQDKRYQKLKQFNMELPEGIPAFLLLKAANMPEDSEKLARATVTLDIKI